MVCLYTTGKGVKADPEQAMQWLEKAASAGYRSEWEREKSFGMCLELRGITFKKSCERTAWLRARYNETEAEVLQD